MLLATWSLGVAPPNLKTLGNVSFIVIGVIIASFGEIKFNLIGFLFQIGGITFEAIRLVMVQRLLSSAEFKMDPLVSLYYFAPACAVMNFLVACFFEFPKMTMDDIYGVGVFILLANAMVAFLLNVSVVFLVSPMRSIRLVSFNALIIIADWQDIFPRVDFVWCPQGYPPGRFLHGPFPGPCVPSTSRRLRHCLVWSCLLQARC